MRDGEKLFRSGYKFNISINIGEETLLDTLEREGLIGCLGCVLTCVADLGRGERRQIRNCWSRNCKSCTISKLTRKHTTIN